MSVNNSLSDVITRLIEYINQYYLKVFENFSLHEPNKLFLLIMLLLIAFKIKSIFCNKRISKILNKRNNLIISKKIYKHELASLNSKYNTLIVDQNKKRKFEIIKMIDELKKGKENFD